jgi:hypothetical protein
MHVHHAQKKHQILPLCLPNHSWSTSSMEKMRKSIKSFQTTLTFGSSFFRSRRITKFYVEHLMCVSFYVFFSHIF